MASIVEQEGIGLCIDSVEQLNTLLASVTDEQMEEMRKNVRRVSQQLSRGEYLRRAVEQAVNELG